MAKDQTDQFKSIYTQVDGLSIHARASLSTATEPSKPILVLIHGLLISSRYMMPIAECLADDYRVFVPDMPGFGQSDNPPHIFSLQELANSVIAWMDALNLPRAIFIGNSLGCQVIVDLAIRYPERVDRLILTAPTVDPYARSMFWQFIRLVMDGPLEDISLAFPMLIDVFAGGPYRAVKTFRYALADPIQAKLTQVKAPTLVVRGDCDPVVSQAWVEKATALLPNGQLNILKQAPHCVTFSTPDELASVVRTFLQAYKDEAFDATDADKIRRIYGAA